MYYTAELMSAEDFCARIEADCRQAAVLDEASVPQMVPPPAPAREPDRPCI